MVLEQDLTVPTPFLIRSCRSGDLWELTLQEWEEPRYSDLAPGPAPLSSLPLPGHSVWATIGLFLNLLLHLPKCHFMQKSTTLEPDNRKAYVRYLFQYQTYHFHHKQTLPLRDPKISICSGNLSYHYPKDFTLILYLILGTRKSP